MTIKEITFKNGDSILVFGDGRTDLDAIRKAHMSGAHQYYLAHKYGDYVERKVKFVQPLTLNRPTHPYGAPGINWQVIRSIKVVPVNELPLYINWPCKSELFDKVLSNEGFQELIDHGKAHVRIIERIERLDSL